MTRQVQAVEVNKFNAGLITDASPLTTPDNSSLDEDNFVLNIDGSRNRRLGMDYETDYTIIDTDVPYVDGLTIGVRAFRWDNAGGEPGRSIQVVQVGNQLDFFHLDDDSVSNGYFNTQTFPNSALDVKFSFAVVDGLLVVVNGDKDVYVLEFAAPNTISRSSQRLLIRDFFGVDDIIGILDLTRGSDVQFRSGVTTPAHTYNLRNQSFGIPRVYANNEDIEDPILSFAGASSGRFPSNSDTVVSALYPDPADEDGRTVDRFFATDLFKNPIGSTRAPQGYFIIDALDRGASRTTETLKNNARFPQLGLPSTPLPVDSSVSGATTITEFAGRVFYSGFPGEVIGGDNHSPKLSSYVLFSKVVESPADISVCYQSGDPTSKDSPDIIATDGGFIRVNEAYGIHKLINLGSSLMVVATNGIWRIVGGSDNGFTANSYIVEKISDRGCTSPDSIAPVDGGFMFWGNDAIYYVHTDQYGGWVCDNISFGRIQRFYDDINIGDKQKAYGAYDSYERKVRWLFYNSTNSSSLCRELVLDLQLQAYYTNTIKQLTTTYPKPAAMYLGLSYQVDVNETSIVVNNDPVFMGTDPIIISARERLGVSQRELGYVVVTSISPTISYTFAKYTNPDFRDWYSVDNVGVDADAFLITSYMSGGDFQRDKQLPYITIHMRRTENGFDDDLNPINQSSCLVQARWDWSNSDRAGKWGREFQAYRYRRLYLPTDSSDDYDNGFSTVVTRNKVRGNGKVLSLKFRTEPDRNLHLYGWSMIFSVGDNV
jgi:hypothetical protein